MGKLYFLMDKNSYIWSDNNFSILFYITEHYRTDRYSPNINASHIVNAK